MTSGRNIWLAGICAASVLAAGLRLGDIVPGWVFRTLCTLALGTIWIRLGQQVWHRLRQRQRPWFLFWNYALPVLVAIPTLASLSDDVVPVDQRFLAAAATGAVLACIYRLIYLKNKNMRKKIVAGNWKMNLNHVEATGVDTTRDEIIQIAGLRLGRDGKAKAEFKRLLRARRSVGDSYRVHKISDAILQQEGEEPEDVLREFCAFAEGAVIVGHNVTYDLSILGSELARLGLPLLAYRRYYDTLDIFRRFYPNLPNHKLEYLGEFCKVSHRSTHDAMDDVCATAEILTYAIEKNIRPHVGERREFIAKWQDVFAELADCISGFRHEAERMRPWQLLAKIVVDIGIDAYYRRRGEEQRIENLRDLFRQARAMDEKEVRPLDALTRFLNYVTLSNTNLDAVTKKQQIPIVTIHQAKGAEFDYVFVAGLQEGTFPGLQAEKNESMAEEARLFYVAITRPKVQLFLSWCQTQHGHYTHMSRFLRDLPREYVQNE